MDQAGGVFMVDDCSAVLTMQRLNRLGTIRESDEAYNVEDQAEQLCHIAVLGLLSGHGLAMQDATAVAAANSSSLSKGAGRGSSKGRRLARAFSGGRQEEEAGVLSLDDWLCAKDIHLSDLQLVQLHAQPADSASTHSSKRSAKQARSSSEGKPGAAAAYQVLVRRGMEEQLLATFREWGFTR